MINDRRLFSPPHRGCSVSDSLPFDTDFGLDHVSPPIGVLRFIFTLNSSCALHGLSFGRSIFGTLGASGS